MSTGASQNVVICNARGLHARAAAKFAKAAETFDAEITVEKDGQSAPGHSIMELLMLSAATGAEIKISADGPDAKQAVETLARLVCEKFGEDC